MKELLGLVQLRGEGEDDDDGDGGLPDCCCFLLCFSVFLLFFRPCVFFVLCRSWLFFFLFFLPLLCSAFYRARELALNQSLLQSCIYRTVNQSTSGIVGKRCGP